MNPFLFVYVLLVPVCVMCVTVAQRPATVYWYQPLVPETGQCDICLTEVVVFPEFQVNINLHLHYTASLVNIVTCFSFLSNSLLNGVTCTSIQFFAKHSVRYQLRSISCRRETHLSVQTTLSQKGESTLTAYQSLHLQATAILTKCQSRSHPCIWIRILHVVQTAISASLHIRIIPETFGVWTNSWGVLIFFHILKKQF